MILSIPFIPETKATCIEEIRLDRKGLSQATIIFVMILYSVLHRLIGRKLPILSAPICLGVSVMRFLFMCFGTLSLLKAPFTIFVTVSPTNSQKHWKKPRCGPSGPSAKKGFRDHNASLTSKLQFYQITSMFVDCSKLKFKSNTQLFDEMLLQDIEPIRLDDLCYSSSQLLRFYF